MPKPRSEPTYQHHKGSGQARTVINGKSIYLGKYNSRESQERFNDIKAEWRLNNNVDQYTLTVDNLAIQFLTHAATHYLAKDGTPTGTAENFRFALRYLISSQGKCRVREFGPKKLKAVREAMVAAGQSRSYVNGMVGKIKQVFRWGVEEELVPPAIYDALKAVAWLRAGRSDARETGPILPVDEGTVNDTLPHLPPIVRDMVRLQLLCGARPGELCGMRPCDVTRGTSGVWIYRPASHKTEHHGRDRKIFIGPEGQSILSRYLTRTHDAYCFSPIEAEQDRNSEKRKSRRTPMTPSQAARKPKGRTLQKKYSRHTYNRAIQRGCEIAFGMPEELRNVARTVARRQDLTEAEQSTLKRTLNAQAATWRNQYCWSPNQLRHSRATGIRERYGLEAAQTILGHADPKITEIYAERDFEMAARIMAEIG